MHTQLNRSRSILRIRKAHEKHEVTKKDVTVESIMRLSVVKLLPKDERDMIVEDVFTAPPYPLNPTLRPISKVLLVAKNDREPDFERELAENGYDQWLKSKN